jgi:hypothetical protein
MVAGAVATRLLTRPRDVNWRDSLDFIYNPSIPGSRASTAWAFTIRKLGRKMRRRSS